MSPAAKKPKSNWADKTIFTGDNLPLMRGMNSESVDLIYLDPPFNSKRDYEAPIGSQAAGAAFKDAWALSDVDIAEHGRLAESNPTLYSFLASVRGLHSKGMMSYLLMMAPRLQEMKRLLKPTGSIYLHCDPTAGHYLKLLMDCVFGRANFKNDLIWRYGRSGRGAKAIAKHFPRNHDNILYYARNHRKHIHQGVWDHIEHQLDKLPSHIRHDESGYFKTAPRGDYTDTSVARLEAEGRIYQTSSGNVRIRYDLECSEKGVLEPVLTGSVWDIPDMMHAPKRERQKYPTQKPLALLELIVKASSGEGDIVFDPFCGCATALVAADSLERQWIGCDLSEKATELVENRIRGAQGLWENITPRDDIPRRTDIGDELTAAQQREHRKTLYGQQMGFCNGCKHHFPLHGLAMDHIVPRAKGGTSHAENFQLLCSSCNSRKGAGTQAQLLARIADEGIRPSKEWYGSVGTANGSNGNAS